MSHSGPEGDWVQLELIDELGHCILPDTCSLKTTLQLLQRLYYIKEVDIITGYKLRIS